MRLLRSLRQAQDSRNDAGEDCFVPFDKLRVLAMTSSFIGHCEPDESGRGNLRDERLFQVMIA